MSLAAVSERVALAPWQGWIRAGSGFPQAREQNGPQLQLGAAVFSLPDPEEAATTSWAREGQFFAVFTGHLQNREELREQVLLEAQGPPPDLSSPARIFLAGYRRWGREVLARLDGVFSCALWDAQSATLLGGRDPLGLHPFYYSLAHGGLIFSWDLEAVRRHPDVSRDLNPVVIAEDLMYRLSNREETHFRVIRRLPGGHGMEFSRGRLEVFPHWDPVPPGRPISWVTDDEVAKFPVLFRQAVKRAIDGRPSGIFLSGGFDSVSVAAWAAELAADGALPLPQAFSAIFPDSISEEPTQRKVAAALGMRQTFVKLEDCLAGRGLLAPLLDEAAFYPAPRIGIWDPVYEHLLRLARAQGCECVLTGDGGDEWLGVASSYAADLIRTGNLVELAQMAAVVLRSFRLPPLSALRCLLWTDGLRVLLRDRMWRRTPALAMALRRRHLAEGMPGWLAPDPELRRALMERFERWDRPDLQPPDSFYIREVRLAIHHPLVSLNYEERFYRDAGVGIPSVHPYLDRPLLDFLVRNPPRVLNRGNRSKGLVRQAVAERFPELGFEQHRKVSASDLAKQIYRREGPVLWQGLGRARHLSQMGIVDLLPFHDMLATCTKSDEALSLYRLWHTASVEAWVGAHS